MTNPEERKYYQRDIIRICQNRGWDAKEIENFLNVYEHKTYGYTLQDVDQFDEHPGRRKNRSSFASPG